MGQQGRRRVNVRHDIDVEAAKLHTLLQTFPGSLPEASKG
jgi:hypothetical protein